ncbi:MAG: hypothetical protein COV47_02925 [Candidatus Diapherotrites archaeon CG11_big_fil_rev_8_21_14_0_20_37_9]|nr:MAG: hypothetical protein COV47_02925 [Candidatus Diapherotrites archaeon CG11_big_fil_rev_8_21_14_0_20_37_9]
MIHKTLNEIKIIDCKGILIHENPDPKRVKKIVDSLVKTNTLNDPLIVTRLKDKFVLLDGVNRLTSLQSLGVNHIPCQVVDYFTDRVELANWSYICDAEVNFDRFPTRLSKHYFEPNGGILICQKNLYKKLQINDKKELVVETNKILEKIAKTTYVRAFNVHAEDLIENQSAIIFPQIIKEDVIELSSNGLKFNAGITRHVIQDRILNFCFDLNFLKSNFSMAEKQKELEKRKQKILSQEEARKYAETVITITET